MKELLVAGALIFVIVAVIRTIGTSMTGVEPALGVVILEALVSSVLLAPLLFWIRPRREAVAAAPVDSTPRTIDPISNTLNMRGLTINLLETMALAERYDRELAVVMMSMDDTDAVHDRFGDAGVEAALELIGETLIETLRVPDRSGRYEGDTFLLVLPETGVDGGKLIAERIRRAVVDLPVKAKGKAFSVSVSSGVAAFRKGDDPQLLIDRAQVALREANDLGQNRTVAHAS